MTRFSPRSAAAKPRASSAACLLSFALLLPALAAGVFDIRSHGAAGDGATLDTAAIQSALDACRDAGGGQVRFPPGRYLSGTLHLRSHATLWFEAGATLVGTTNLNLYQAPVVPDFMPEARWGKWHRGLIVGESVEDVTLAGPGVIDGQKVFDPTGEEKMRGPHAFIFVNCRRLAIRDLTFLDAANYAVFFQASDDIEFRGVRFVGGWDGIHWRGAPDRWCHNVRILDCDFQTGDDSIAGRYWDNTLIRGCVINSSCNGIRLIGPATRLTIANNLFQGPGAQPHRTSGEKRRTNMLSGIILQPGAWDATRGPLDDVLIADNTMQRVASPVTVWTKPGNSVGRVTITGLNATGVYRSAVSFESWADEPMGRMILRSSSIEFTGGGKAWAAGETVKGPGVDARPLPAWGIYARHVSQLTVEDVRLSLSEPDARPVIFADDVPSLELENVRHPKALGGSEAIFTTNGTRLKSSATETH